MRRVSNAFVVGVIAVGILTGALAIVGAVVQDGAGSTTKRVRFGGVVCVGQPSGGVICRRPPYPWAVGITAGVVIVWKNNAVQFVRTNR